MNICVSLLKFFLLIESYMLGKIKCKKIALLFLCNCKDRLFLEYPSILLLSHSIQHFVLAEVLDVGLNSPFSPSCFLIFILLIFGISHVRQNLSLLCQKCHFFLLKWAFRDLTSLWKEELYYYHAAEKFTEVYCGKMLLFCIRYKCLMCP